MQDRKREIQDAGTIRSENDWRSDSTSDDFDSSEFGSQRSNPNQFLWSVRSALRRRWLPALILGLMAGIAASAGMLLGVGRQYESFALLRVVPNAPRLVFEHSDTDAVNLYETFRRTQASLIASPAVLNRALDQPDVRVLPEVIGGLDPVQWLAEKLRVEPIRDSEVLRVSIVRPNPAAAAALINAVTNAYVELIVQGENRDRLQKIDLLEQERRTRADELERKRKTLRQLADQVGTMDSGALTERQRASLNRFADMQKELTRLELDTLAAKARFSLLESQAAGDEIEVPEAAIEQDLRADSRVQFYDQAIAEIDYQAAELRRRIRSGDDPSLVQLDRRRQVLAEALEARQQEQRPEIEQRRRKSAREDLDRNLAVAKQKVDQLVEQQKVLSEVVDRERREADKIGRTSLDIKFLQDELTQVEQIFQQVVQRLDELRVEAKAPGRVTVMSKADPPRAPYQRRRQQVVACMIGVIAFAAVQFLILATAFWRPRIGTAEELATGCRIPVLGSLPRISAGQSATVGNKAAQARKHRCVYESAVDNLQALLLLDGLETDCVTLAITSAVRGEGKTTLASQLAASAARSGKKVLLIDADLRNPSLHSVCGLPQWDGLVQILKPSRDSSASPRATSVAGLDLLSAGVVPDRPDSIFAGAAFAQALTELKQRYSFIVIDSPPVLSVPDTLHIARLCEMTVLSTLRDVSELALVRRACERLERVGVDLRGAVLNATGAMLWLDSEFVTEKFVRDRDPEAAESAEPAGVS